MITTRKHAKVNYTVKKKEILVQSSVHKIKRK